MVISDLIAIILGEFLSKKLPENIIKNFQVYCF